VISVVDDDEGIHPSIRNTHVEGDSLARLERAFDQLRLENEQLKRQVQLQSKKLEWMEGRFDLLNWRLCGADTWTLKGHHQQGVTCSRLSPIEGLLASGSADKCILQWDIKTASCTQRLRGHTGSVLSLHSEGNTLVSSSADKTICIWNFTTGEFIGSLKGHSGPVSFSTSF